MQVVGPVDFVESVSPGQDWQGAFSQQQVLIE
jgi:hypothetical protein